MLRINGCNKVYGTLEPDSDKSITHRAIMFSAIAEGVGKVDNLLLSDDIHSTIECLQQLGTKYEFNSSKQLTIYPNKLKQPLKALYAGNSGTTLRLLSGILAGQNFSSTLYGDESLNKRPMGRIIEPLRLMGADIRSSGDQYCPLEIIGTKLHAITYTQGISSAQQKSAILLAGLYAEGTTKVIEKAQSRNHTEIMLSVMGAAVRHEEGKVSIKGGGRLQGQEFFVPGDISTAAFFLALAAIKDGSMLTLQNVGLNPTRTGIIEVLQKMGADIEICPKNDKGEVYGDITIRGRGLKGIEISGEIIPRLIDELPIICVCAAFADGVTTIRDAAELKVKESNRIDCMVQELQKGGITAYALPDGMVVHGGGARGGNFYSYNDHRIAMSMIIFALCALGESTIVGEECCSISSPNFISSLNTLTNGNCIR